MKEHHHAFITASALFFASDKAGEAVGLLINTHTGVMTYAIIVAIAVGLVLRGLYVMLPYPLSGAVRSDFDDAHPDAYLMSRSQRVLLYKRWRKNG